MGTGLAGFGLFWEEIAAWSEQAGSWMLLVNITPIDWTLGQGVKRRTVEKPRAWLARLVNITYNVGLNAPLEGRLSEGCVWGYKLSGTGGAAGRQVNEITQKTTSGEKNKRLVNITRGVE